MWENGRKSSPHLSYANIPRKTSKAEKKKYLKDDVEVWENTLSDFSA